jgi:hypothetical protein
MDPRAVKRLFLLLVALFLAVPARGEAAGPSAEAQLAAGAVVSLHNAVMRDVLKSDFEFTGVVGSEESLMLFSDPDKSAYLLVSFDEKTLSRAETAVLQTYDINSFKSRAALSLQALALPFLTGDEQATFADWLAARLDAAEVARRAGEDYELTYYEGTYVACAASVYHDGGRAMFTLLAHWYAPLSADDITALMED